MIEGEANTEERVWWCWFVRTVRGGNGHDRKGWGLGYRGLGA